MLFSWKGNADPKIYERVPFEEWDEENSDNNESETLTGFYTPRKPSHKPPLSPLARILVASVTVFVLLLRCIRPSDTAYTFLSQTVIITPFENPPGRSQTSSFDLPDLPGDYSWLYNHTALAAPPKFDWLPKRK